MLLLTLTLGAKNRGKENNLKERIENRKKNEKEAKSTSYNSDIMGFTKLSPLFPLPNFVKYYCLDDYCSVSFTII